MRALREKGDGEAYACARGREGMSRVRAICRGGVLAAFFMRLQQSEGESFFLFSFCRVREGGCGVRHVRAEWPFAYVGVSCALWRVRDVGKQC